jgi:hypothetical protein
MIHCRKIFLLRELLGGSALVISAALGACASRPSFEQPPVVHSVQEAAAIRVTALSVARWEDYVDALQMQFSMTPDLATSLAFPQTSISQTSVADSLGLGLQVGLPQSTHTASQGTSGNQGTTTTATTAVNQGSTTNTSNSTSTSANSATNSNSTALAPGVAPASTLPTQTAPSTSGIAGPTGVLQVDPIDSYNAAASIYEEVQLLNRYLQDGALRYGYVPYVARMQISVMPFARNEPYDVYLDIGLFSQCERDDIADALPVVVVPLLVTDDIEKGQATNATNIARQLALNIAGVVDNVGLGANLSNLSDNFQSLLADTFNSRFMVSRGADNVLEVRIGAATSPVTKVGYSMLAQTHNLSFLLLVKREHAAVAGGRCSPDPKTLRDARVHGTGIESGPVVQLSTLARLKNAKSGEEVVNDRATMLEHARNVVRAFASHVSDDTLDKLLQDLNQPDSKAFRADLPPALRPAWTTLWTGLTSVLSMSQYNGTHFNLPYRRVPHAIEAQAVIIHDNCKDTATTSLVGFNDAVAGQFNAALELKSGVYVIAASSVVQSTPGAPLTITFPTLNEFGREAEDIKNACATSGATPNPPRKLEGAKLIVRRLVDDRWIAPEEKGIGTDECLEKCLFAFDSVIMDGTPQLSQTVGLLAAADSIVTDPTTGSGKMRLLVTIGKDLDSVKFSLSGAVLPNSTQPTVTGAATIGVAGGGFSITPTPTVAGATAAPPGPLAVDLSLQGLVVGRAVTITGTGQKSGKATTAAIPIVVVPIVAPPAASKPPTTGN